MGRRLIERSCRHRCTGDKPFFCRIMKHGSHSRRARCQMRLSYLIARCAKWCHRHTCARRATERRLNDRVRPYDKELIHYRADGRTLEVVRCINDPIRESNILLPKFLVSDRSACGNLESSCLIRE